MQEVIKIANLACSQATEIYHSARKSKENISKTLENLDDVKDSKNYKFSHAIKYHLPDKKILIGCYHPSPRNVNTKRINLNMMVKLLKNARKINH